MADYLIYGVSAKGARTRLAHTPSARAAREYRDREDSSWGRIVVCGGKIDLTEAELDKLADLESRLFKFS